MPSPVFHTFVVFSAPAARDRGSCCETAGQARDVCECQRRGGGVTGDDRGALPLNIHLRRSHLTNSINVPDRQDQIVSPTVFMGMSSPASRSAVVFRGEPATPRALCYPVLERIGGEWGEEKRARR